MPSDYVHGYSDREQERLLDQASTLSELLHAGTRYPAGSRVLEAGCGVGAQTLPLATNGPGARFTCVDVSAESLAAASARAERRRSRTSPSSRRTSSRCRSRRRASTTSSSASSSSTCDSPRTPSRRSSRGCAITVIEGDHGSTFFHPDDADARRAVECLVTLQARADGDALVGRRLHPLLAEAGLREVAVAWQRGIAGLRRAAGPDGVFCYTFFKAVGVR